MKTAVTLLTLLILCPLSTSAQDYTQWHLPKGAKARLGKGHITGNIAHSPDGTRLAMASSIGIWIYDAHTGKERALLAGHTAGVLDVAFSPDGATLASWSLDYTIRLWEANTGEHLHTLNGAGWVSSVAFSPDGTTLASTSLHYINSRGTDRMVWLWDVNTGELIRTLNGHTGSVNSVSFSPDGATLASGSSDDTVRFWDANTGELIRTFNGHTGDVNSVAFSPDGATLASGSSDDTVRLWEANTGELIRTLNGHTRGVETVAFSPDGSTIATGGNAVSGSWNYTVKLWDTKAWRSVQMVRPLPVEARTIQCGCGRQTQENSSEHSTGIRGVSKPSRSVQTALQLPLVGTLSVGVGTIR